MLFEQERSSITIPCEPIKRLYRIILHKQQLQISDMAFLLELFENLLREVENGESASGLWIRMRMDDDFYGFSDLLEQCIRRCLLNFDSVNRLN